MAEYGSASVSRNLAGVFDKKEGEFPVERHTLAYKGGMLEVYQDEVRLPDGRSAVWDKIEHKGAAAVIPVTEDGRILMVRQYRHAIGRYTLEIPAGGRNSVSEPMLETARRELQEETGFQSDDYEFLVSINTVAAYSSEQIDIFVARNLYAGKQNLDEDEFIDVKSCSVDEIRDMIYKGLIRDAKTIAAIMTYKDRYPL